MSVFQKFSPGLGHDGVGLYGTLTSKSMAFLVNRLNVRERLWLMWALRMERCFFLRLHGASRAYGLEIARGGLDEKFDAMMKILKRNATLPPDAHAEITCGIDITQQKSTSLIGMLRDCFKGDRSHSSNRKGKFCASAVWHGFRPLQRRRFCAASQRAAITLIVSVSWALASRTMGERSRSLSLSLVSPPALQSCAPMTLSNLQVGARSTTP